jgi:hypothetical protein
MNDTVSTVKLLKAKREMRKTLHERDKALVQEIQHIIGTERLHHREPDRDVYIKACFSQAQQSDEASMEIMVTVKKAEETSQTVAMMTVPQARALAGWIQKHLGD